jgi:hypothetical protein
VALVALTGVLFVPLLLPVLRPERLAALQAAVGFKAPKSEVSHEAALEQRLGDQFGWREMTDEVAVIYRSLTPAERARTGIYAENYGEAGAIDQFGPALGLPPAICAHQADCYWGLPAVEPTTLICLGCSREGLEQDFDSVIQAGDHEHPWGMRYENGPIYLCRGLHTPLKVLWPRITRWT